MAALLDVVAAALELAILDFSRYFERAARKCGFAFDCELRKVSKPP